MLNSLFRKKPLESTIEDARHGGDGHGSELRKVLGVRDLTSMGIAAVIGAGIFSTIGQAAYNGGPGVIFLFIITAITCGFTALCYAEFASRIPVAGSAYTYSYVTFGEVTAWIIGWALILEYGIGNVVVSISWSSYFVNLLEGLGLHLPPWLATDPETAHQAFLRAQEAGETTIGMAWTTAPTIIGFKFIANLPAALIILIITILAYIGIKESKKSANFMVALKLVVLAIIVIIGLFYIDTDNWTPFLPNGFSGVLKGVSAVFFAYIGFDAISTTAEECANPQRDMPKGMIYSLIICTLIYVVVTLVITGMVHYGEFNNVSDPLAYVFEKINLSKVGFFISVSAVVAATSVLLVFQIGQPRIWMSMSRDGLLPGRFASIHPKHHTPAFSTIITGIIVGIPSLFVESALMTDLTSIGTLFAFVLVCGGVLVLPKESNPGVKRFRLPYINGQFIIPVLLIIFLYSFQDRISDAALNLSHDSRQELLFLIFIGIAIAIAVVTFIKKFSLIPVLGMLCCLYLMIEIPARSWVVFFGWMAFGLVIYFSYGYWKSRLAVRRI
ncbi:amino acid permease [Chryseosolibacter indicus]|uniref:Amino acid permease n=1 Tax=Chryseosolibacter indicus TaxID=2782351 RepID=A0ABS5VMU8_9BACT|nr:amino acid permease [Chryseosolibacter indicus]MBT1702777.1 amino acid permease [Chryseosolibacter indicus]